nr:MAG TPA: hypothetical protein [Caudoviricetes sp.]
MFCIHNNHLNAILSHSHSYCNTFYPFILSLFLYSSSPPTIFNISNM